MRLNSPCRWLLGPLLLALLQPLSAHNGDQTAYAIPLTGITIDGRLDDWPDEMVIYPIEWVHPTEYQASPPRGPHDLTASFRVGYDADSDLLFVAIVVRDDEMVAYPTYRLWHSQDQCEIYLDADHSGGDVVADPENPDASRQYRRFPGPSTPAEERASGVTASHRVGDLLVYEWAIPIYTSFPEERLDIRPGASIGFDVAVCDADDAKRGNWVAWSPEGRKVDDSGLFGDLVFAEAGAPEGAATGPTMPPDADRVGRISGRVSFAGNAAREARVQLLRDAEVMSSTWVGTAGVYRLETRAGRYTLRAFAGEDTVRRDVRIQTGRDDTLHLRFHGPTRTARGTGSSDDTGIIVAVTAPVDGILIDGDLSDWPDGVDEQVVGTTPPGRLWWAPDTGLDVQAARGPADLEAWVRFGYDSDRQILYGGITARDDSHIPVEEGVGPDFDHIRAEFLVPTLQDTVVWVFVRIEPSASDSSITSVFMRSKEQGDLYREPEGVTAYACSAGDSVYVYEFLVDLGLAAARFRDWPSNGPVRARVLVGDVDADGSITSAEWGRSWGAGGWLIPSGSPASALSAAIHPVLRQADSRRWNALRTYVPVTAGVVIAVVHLFLFAFYPAAKENLAMAALALAGVYVLVWMGSLRSSDLQVMAGIFLAWSITGLGYWLLHEVLSMPRTRRFWVYVATVLLMAATHVARSRGAVEFIAEEVFLTAAVLLLLELFRVIITEALRGNREGLLVGMAFLAFSGLFFSDQPWTLWGQAEASLMLMTVLLSLHLARRAARTSRLLARANAEIEAATRNKSQFLRRMSHDLRSPMNAIIGYTRVVLRRSRDRLDERQVRNLENIGTSSNNLLSLINDILDLSRIEAGRIEVDVQPVDLRQLADECADALGSIVKPGVELRRQLSDVGQIQTDPDRLRQVVMNLLGNATKFTDTGSITLSLRSADGTVELSVADTGVGIPPEDLPHIFDEFRQVERQGGEQTEGTGLGLAIAKKTVELLGGTLSAVSAGGAGTTFTLRIGDYETA